MKTQNRSVRMSALVIIAMVTLGIAPVMAQVDSSKNARQSQMPPNQTNPNTQQNQPAYPTQPNHTVPNPQPNQQTVPNPQPNQQTIPNPQPPSHTDPKKEQIQLSQPNQQQPGQVVPDNKDNSIRITDAERKTLVGNDKKAGKDGKGNPLYRGSDGRKYYINENGNKIYVK